MRKESIRDKDKVKKTSKRYVYANYAKKPQRRVTRGPEIGASAR